MEDHAYLHDSCSIFRRFKTCFLTEFPQQVNPHEDSFLNDSLVIFKIKVCRVSRYIGVAKPRQPRTNFFSLRLFSCCPIYDLLVIPVNLRPLCNKEPGDDVLGAVLFEDRNLQVVGLWNDSPVSPSIFEQAPTPPAVLRYNHVISLGVVGLRIVLFSVVCNSLQRIFLQGK